MNRSSILSLGKQVLHLLHSLAGLESETRFPLNARLEGRADESIMK